MEIRSFKKNEVIFKQGSYEAWMYDIRFGKVGIYANYGQKDQRLLKEVGEDGYFGEMGLIEAYPRSATAVSLVSGTQCSVITSEDFSEYFSKKPAKILAIMQYMSHRIRELTDELAKAKAK